MPDNLSITGLKVPTRIGVHRWEQQIEQILIVDMQLQTNIRKAAADDDLKQTLDYWLICERVKAFLAAESHNLIETVAEKISQLLLAEFATDKVTVRVAKPNVSSELNDVAVEISREANAAIA